MFTRLLVLGILVVGAVGQVACTETAEAAQLSTVTESDPAAGEAPRQGQFCGGFAAIQCPEGLVCVDDPKDTCDPTAGGADCGGICVKQGDKKPRCDYEDPTLSYVSRDPNECLAILFKCPEGSTAFFNDCGCGCTNPGTTTCNYEDPKRRYVSQDPNQCALIRYVCNEGETAFSDSCGCGCELAPAP